MTNRTSIKPHPQQRDDVFIGQTVINGTLVPVYEWRRDRSYRPTGQACQAVPITVDGCHDMYLTTQGRAGGTHTIVYTGHDTNPAAYARITW